MLKNIFQDKLRLSFIVGIFGLFIFLEVVFYNQTQLYVYKEAEKKILNILDGYKAVRRYVENEQKIQIFELQSKGVISEDYFNPILLSSTYGAKGVNQYYNSIRAAEGKPPISIKYASPNPTNPNNKATKFEAELLEKFNKNELQKYYDIIDTENGKAMYYIIPTQKNQPRCMRCHSDPASAPKGMVAMYGEKSGFFEKEGEIRALLTLVYPLEEDLESAKKLFIVLSLFSFVFVFIVTYLVFKYKTIIQHKENELRGVVDNLDSTIEKKTAELREINYELQNRANLDQLTNLFNRHKFEELKQNGYFEKLIEYGSLSVILFDIDYFKSINDRFGHEQGDEILLKFAKLVKGSIREDDILFRWGGEEFLLIIKNGNPKDAYNLAKKIKNEIENFDFGIKEKITTSFGIAGCMDYKNLKDLIKNADDALYEAKNNGRNTIVIK